MATRGVIMATRGVTVAIIEAIVATKGVTIVIRRAIVGAEVITIAMDGTKPHHNRDIKKTGILGTG